jgi:DNA-directed RNA polymerase subunit RPC12/RpoP
MPVRFRCVYCNQLLGISRRKAGTVVRCTNCEGQIIVPEAEPEMQAVAAGQANAAGAKEHQPLPNDLFERNDLDALLRPFDFDHPEPVLPPAEPKAPPSPAPPSLEELNTAAEAWAAPTRKKLFAAYWLISVIIALAIGFLIGRASIPTP